MKEETVSHPGRWQVVLLVFIGWNNVIVAINHALPTFLGYTPTYYCQFSDGGNFTRVHGCVASDNECLDGYQFDTSQDENTIVTEWNLVCDRRLLKPLVASLYFCGVLIGAPTVGLLADRFGRRFMMLISLYGQGILGLALISTNSLVAFTIVRFIQGFFVQGLQGSTYTLLVEIFSPGSCAVVGVVLEIYWALGLSILTGSSYFVPDWRTLQLVLSVPTILTLAFVCMVPESPRWLVTRGRHREAALVREKIAKLNGFSKSHMKKSEDLCLPIEKHDSNYCREPIQSPHITTTALHTPVASPLEEGSVKDNFSGNHSTASVTHTSVVSNGSCVKLTNGKSHEGCSYSAVNGTVVDKDSISCCDVNSIELRNVNMASDTLVGEKLETTVQLRTVDKKLSFLDIFRSRLLRKFFFVMIFIWFNVSLMYYGIMFYMPALSGNRHLNFLLGAVLEALSYCLAYVILSRFGRRLPQTTYQVISGILCISVGILSTVQANYPILQTTLALLGKAAVVSSFCTIFIYTSELFPTVVRAAALGYCSCGSRVGSLLAPQLLLLGEYTTNVVPLVCMGVSGTLSGFITLLLPETAGNPLVDTVQEAEDRANQAKHKHPDSLSLNGHSVSPNQQL